MMKKREFVTRVRRQLPSYLPEDIRSDVRLSEVRTTKTNDRKLYGLSIRRGGEAAAPTFYLDDLYHRYVMGEDPDDLIRMFAEEYLQLEKLRRVPLGMPPPDEDGCVTLLALRLLSRERNRDYLQNLPYLDVGNGLVLTCDFRAWDNSSGEWRMRITHDLLGELGLTEEELRTNNAARIHKSRSQEFYNVVYCAAMARDSIRQDDGQSMGGNMKGVAEYCIKYLKKYPKVRSTQSGRDSYELALNLLATCADPNDPEVKACIDGVNAKRGAKPGTKNFIDLGDYGPDRLLGRKVPAGEYIKDVDKRIAEQLKRSKDKSLTPNDMLKAKYEANRLKVEKLYLKTAVTPSEAVYPDRIAEKTKELWSDKRLMDTLVANQSEKEQARIMREHLALKTASAQPKTVQKEKQQDAPVAGK